MTEADRRYLAGLVRAWLGSRRDPVPRPASVSAPAIWTRLCAHNVEGTLGELLPVEDRPEAFARRMAAARDRPQGLLMECERILPALTAAEPRPVLLKGAALALDRYPDPGDRWFIDLDILVPRPRLDAVCAAAHEVGYRPLTAGFGPDFYDQHHFHRILLGPQGACLEVHWDLTLPGSVYRHDPDGVISRARPAVLGRREVWTPAPIDHMLHATYQNVADGYRDLRRVLDLALIARELDELAWAHLADEAREKGFWRALVISLHIMKLITGVRVPSDLRDLRSLGSAAGRTLNGLDLVSGCLERRSLTAQGYTQLLHLVAVPRRGSRWRELGRLVWPAERAMMELGHPSGRFRGPVGRLLMGLRQVMLLGRMGWMAARAYARG